MGDAYRIATKVPWENHVRDWSGRYPTVDDVLRELRDRAQVHQGNGYQERVYGHEPWGKVRPLNLTLEATRHNLAGGAFGDIAQVKADKDDVQWWVKKLKDTNEPINRPEANEHIDFLYTYFFRDHIDEFDGLENWGTCNRRHIDGSLDWSEHCPWLAPNPGCNAIDFGASYTVLYKVSRRLSDLGGPHVAKVLFYRHEWTPATGWIYAPSIGTSHDTHVLAEGPRDHGGLAAACNY
jgi:hypothetical protein